MGNAGAAKTETDKTDATPGKRVSLTGKLGIPWRKSANEMNSAHRTNDLDQWLADCKLVQVKDKLIEAGISEMDDVGEEGPKPSLRL